MPKQPKIFRSIIVFDASNFYFKLKTLKLKNKSQFDYLKFSQMIARKTNLINIYYTIGKFEAKPNDPKPVRRMMAKQLSYALDNQCDSSRILVKKDIEKFL